MYGRAGFELLRARVCLGMLRAQLNPAPKVWKNRFEYSATPENSSISSALTFSKRLLFGSLLSKTQAITTRGRGLQWTTYMGHFQSFWPERDARKGEG
jgi:hypothetical protein